MKRKRISKEEAAQKYGILTTGVNSFYSYYLRADGCVIDSDGDIRYSPSVNLNKFKGREQENKI